jgi:tetratricopeptide (TPR) repeat protein
MTANRTPISYLRLVAFICGLALPALGSEPWLRLTSPHFEMLTTAGEKKGREAILYFEAVRGFFDTSQSIHSAVRERRVRIIAFRSAKEFEPYKLNQFSSAFYLAGSGAGTDTIVMSDISRDRYPAAVHEYTHLVLHRSGLELPVWLNEGLADLYSSLHPQGQKIRVGDLLPGRVGRLLSSRPIPLEELAMVDQNSPWYNERDRASVFYAESWALTHMLALSEEYRRGFAQFVGEIAAEHTLGEALESVYRKTVRETQRDLMAYFGGRLVGSLLEAKMDPGAEQPEIEAAPDTEVQLALAEMLASSKRTSSAGRARFEQLQKSHPELPEVEAGLARLELREQNLEEARRHFARAVELGSREGRVYFDYAMMSRGRSGDKMATQMLQRALELDPELEEAHYHLGFVLLRQNQNREALAEFSRVKHVSRDAGFTYYRAVANACLKLGLAEQALTAAQRATKYTQNADDRQALELLLETIRHGAPRF